MELTMRAPSDARVEAVAVELESLEARKRLPSRAEPGERYVGITVEHRVLGELDDC